MSTKRGHLQSPMCKSTVCVHSLLTLTLVRGVHDGSFIGGFSVSEKQRLESLFSSLFLLVNPWQWLFQREKSILCKCCQDFYLMATILCRQMNASFYILSIPRGFGPTHTDTHIIHLGVVSSSFTPRNALQVCPYPASQTLLGAHKNSSHQPSNQPGSLLNVCMSVYVCEKDFLLPRSQTKKHRRLIFSPRPKT